MSSWLRKIFLNKSDRHININRMSSETALRYFINPKPDYEIVFGSPEIPENELKRNLNDIVTKIQSYVKPVERNGGDGLYLGTAGISYMFYHMSKISKLNETKLEYLNKAVEFLKPALVVASLSEKNRKDAASFLLGSCGVHAVASAIYKSLGEESLSDQYRELFYGVAPICKQPTFLNCGSDELFVGRAGYVLGALWLAKETKTPLQKTEIYEICKVIVDSGRDYAVRHHSPCPLMYAYYQIEYLGAAHGLCSILQVLISVPGYLDSQPADAKDIKSCIDFLLSLQTHDGNFPTAMDEIGYKSDLVHWCHGAGGMVYLMAKAYLRFRDDRYLQSCKLMADLIWEKGLLKKGPGLCHGVAGNGYVFLMIYRLTRQPKYLYRAIRFYQFMESNEFKMGARIPDNPYSLYEGLAGTACYIADLLCPFEATFPFSDIF